MKRPQLFMHIFSFLIFTALSLSAQNFTIKPDTVVYVGEPVVFDAEVFLTDKLFTNGTCTTFVWNFNDSSELMKRRGAPYRSGVTIMHYFMKPGKYPVTVSVRDLSGKVKDYTRNVTVEGVELLDSFEVWHAPFHARIAQYIYVKNSKTTVSQKSNRLNVILRNLGTQKDDTLLSKSPFDTSERCLLRHSGLPRGTFLLRAEIVDKSNNVITYLNERFTRTITGDPAIGINEHNALIKNKKPYFPISAWMLHPGEMPNWESGGYCNSIFMVGYLEEHNITTTSNYVNNISKNHGFSIIGFDKYAGKGDGAKSLLRNSRVSSMMRYMDECGAQNMLGYCWDDEPNLGGLPGRVNPNVLASWAYVTEEKDPNHPTITNLAGFFYLPRVQGFGAEYNFLYSKEQFGGRRNVVADIYHGACFAMEGYKRIQYEDPKDSTRKAMDMYAEYLRYKSEWNYGLVPIMGVTATCGIMPGDTNYMPGVTVNQMRMQSWLNIVYGIKGMNWYQYWGVTYPENYGYMAEYYDQVTELAPAILAPSDSSISITDDANERKRRVDCFIRKYDNYYLIIAVRLTEMEYQDDPSFEPESHTVTMTLRGVPLSGKKVFEYKNWSRVADSFDIDSAKSSFTVKTKNLPVPGKVIIAGISDGDTAWGYYFDDGLGNIYRNRDWKIGERWECGEIDYSTGEINFKSVSCYGTKSTPNAQNLKAGKGNLKVVYVPQNPDVRYIDVKGSSFTDNFNREDVHIYIVGDPADFNVQKKYARAKKVTPGKIRLIK